ncbi:hypothetical protein J7L60_01625 [Candidatus Bathyarchaeota archaeon]|nr:hypothetical protein [Candidatus Bathyarchaeota archaeon]
MWISDMASKYPEPLWYYAGCGVLSGFLREPFSSYDLKEFCERFGLYYATSTYNYYPHKHSINHGEEGFTRVFITDQKLYDRFEDVSKMKLDRRRVYRLDKEAFMRELMRRGKSLKRPEEFP